jgi:hypothetical protein
MKSLVGRYESGEHLAVWEALRDGRATTEEETQVADLTMGRVSEAIDVIIERLEAAGWVWAYPGVPRRGVATAEDVAAVSAMESKIGPLPAALRSCLLLVGEVNLAGTLPSWSFTTNAEIEPWDKPVVRADPLWLEPATRLRWQLEDVPTPQEGEAPQPWVWWFSGDAVQKAGLSGSGHFLQLPFEGADPTLIHAQRPGITLVDYLRASLRLGGFPGFEFEAKVPGLVKELAFGLPSF